MNNNYLNFLLAIIFIGEAILSLFGFKVYSKYHGGFIELSTVGICISLIIGISFLYFWIKNKKEQQYDIKYSKCPKCKESFNYSELEKGKCKYCKDVDTIDIEEYYKKYPEELEES